jgi:hypothetical protein
MSRVDPALPIRLLCALTVALAASCSSPGPAGRMPAEGEWIELPADYRGHYFMLPIRFDGEEERTLWFLYDTGANISVVDADSLAAVSSWEPAQGASVDLVDLSCGPLDIRRMPVQVLQLDHLQHAVGRDFDGILGYGAFADFLVQLDYPKQRMRVATGVLPRPDGERSFPLARADRPWVAMELPQGPRMMLIDSGSTAGFELDSPRGIRWLQEPRPVGAGMGIHGLEVNRAGRLDGEVGFLGARYDRPVLFLDDTDLVGTAVLHRYSLIFDQRTRRVVLDVEPPAEVAPTALRGIGALFRPTAEGKVVTEVFPDSAAALVGLQVDDLVLGRAFLREDASAREAPLRIRRDGQEFELLVPEDDLLPLP